MNMNKKPILERKKTPLRQLNADKTTIPRDEAPLQGRTIEITEVEYRFPEAGKEKYGEGASKEAFTSDKPADQNKPGVWEGAKEKLHQGVEKAKDVLKPTTTTTTTPDSELTEKPGVLERVKGVFSSSKDAKDSDYTYTDQDKPGYIQGAKNMVWQGVEKAKGLVSSTKITTPTELHPGNGYEWKRVVGEQGQVCWVATNDWSSDSSNRGGIIEGAKGMVRSGMEKAKGFISSKDAKESEFTDQSKPGVLEGAKQKVWQGVEKAKSVLGVTSSTSNEQHPGRSYTWRKTTGPEGQTHWVARNDWSKDSANQMGQQSKPGIIQGAKEKVMQGVEKAKGVFSSTKTETTDVDPQLLVDQATIKEHTGTYA